MRKVQQIMLYRHDRFCSFHSTRRRFVVKLAYSESPDSECRHRAIKTYVSLLRRGAPALAKEACGEDLEWAIGLLTDCLFRIGVCLKHKERWEQAVNFFAGYEEVVRAGAKSIYKFLDLWKQLAELPQQEIPESSPALPEKRRSPAKVLASVSKEALSRLAA